MQRGAPPHCTAHPSDSPLLVYRKMICGYQEVYALNSCDTANEGFGEVLPGGLGRLLPDRRRLQPGLLQRLQRRTRPLACEPTVREWLLQRHQSCETERLVRDTSY